MSANGEEAKSQELVIIRRSGGEEEEGHHGGVWKIAYADFMTAMMAFFLVMWLINSTDQKTLTQVATYFNPLRLTDKTPVSRGLQQENGAQSKDSSAKEDSAKESAKESAAKANASSRNSPVKGNKMKDHPGKGDAKAEAGKARNTEEALFQDPYGALARLAAEAGKEPGRAGPKGNGEAYRDPFDPAFRREGNPGEHQDASKAPAPAVSGEATPTKGAADAKAADAKVNDGPDSAQRDAAKAAADQKAMQEERIKGEAAQLGALIKQALGQVAPGTIPNIEVTGTQEGVLVSLTDGYEFGMFAIASAEPRPAMVLVMEKLAKVISARPERLVVRGHTDGRPYKQGGYDNWRLSTARAHMAYYMLVRGGIDEKRFERVEGYADRNLRVVSDPEAAQNRRIEILLSRAKP